MNSIDAAADHVRQRSLSELGAYWRELVLADVWGGADKQQSIAARIQSTRTLEESRTGGIFTDEDIRGIALAEMTKIVSKAAHLTRAVQSAHAAGHYTVSVFNGFHGCLLSARALLACFGVFAFNCNYGGSGVNCLVDLFPWCGTPDYSKKFIRTYGSGKTIYRLASYKKKLESQDLWKTLVRILSVGTLGCLSAKEHLKLRSFDYSRLARQRNALIYQGPAWIWPDDLLLEVSRYFAPVDAGADYVAMLELAESGDYPEFILNGLLFILVEKSLLELFPDQAMGNEVKAGSDLLSMLYGSSPRERAIEQAPLSFFRSKGGGGKSLSGPLSQA